jgi:hypothetical protein
MGTKKIAKRSTIVLQNRESQLYLKKEGEWTALVADAAHFEHIADASAFVLRSKLPILDIVMTFGDPKYDVRLRASA